MAAHDDVAGLERIRNALDVPTPIKALVEDEHHRFHLYTAALADAARCDEDEVLSVLGGDPDVAMSEAALVDHLDGRACDLDLAALDEWIASKRVVLERFDFAARRAAEWRLVKRLLAGEAVPAESYLTGSDWLQRKVASEVDRQEVLSVLAAAGRTRRVRAAAGRKIAPRTN